MQGFLIASALYWLEHFHVDGLRVDAVASMLYRDYSRKAGEWVPNIHGGRENLEAIDFLRHLNARRRASAARRHRRSPRNRPPCPASPSRSANGGLGFHYKWNMGWMHDTLRYMARDPIHRRYHHDEMTFGLIYAFSENFVLPLSHDEVVHGKGSLLGRMPGDRWQKFANLRAYFGFMWAHPGKKLLFMGCEFAQEREWNHDASLDWHLLDDPQPRRHAAAGARPQPASIAASPALHELDCERRGLRAGSISDDRDHSVFAFVRRARTATARAGRLQLHAGAAARLPASACRAAAAGARSLNTDSRFYGGSDVGNDGGVATEPMPSHGEPQSLDADPAAAGHHMLRADG